MQEINPNDIRLSAMNLLARREHLRAELAAKLQKRFDDHELVETTLDQLTEENLLSDQRFAESYIHHRANKGYGPDRIRQELRQKGAGGELVSLAMESVETDWAALAREVRYKKFGAGEPADFREKGRQLRFLQYRGFGGEYSSLAFAGED